MAIASVAGVSAATNSNTDGQDNLVNKIAKKFNVKPADVKAVFQEEHQAREAEHQKQFTTNLDKLVAAGTITSAQKDAIIAKQAELKKDMEANRDTMKDKTSAERKALMDQKKAELEKWASDNGLSADVLKQVIGGPHGGMGGGPGAGMRGNGPMGGGMHGPEQGPDADDQAPATTQNQ